MTGQEIKLLVLEDNPSDFELVRRELKKGSRSHLIEWAQNKEDFVRALDKERPDLILLDYNLPGFGGLAGLKLARKRYADVPAIIVSGAIGEEVAIEALKAGATDYVLKQRLERLRPVVERALEEATQLARRRLVENELEETKKRLEAIVGQMPMGLFIIDTKNDETILINEEAGTLFHIDQLNPGNTMDLHHSVKIFDPEVCPPGPNLNFIDEAIRRGGVIKSAVKLIERQDGSRFYARFNIAPVRDANGNEIAVVMMVRDVSEQVESERALARSNKELQDFAYVASHDLQEPLRMVVSYLSLLERKYGAILDAKGHEYIHFAVDGGERMRELIDDLLAYSRVDMRGKEFVPVDMTAVTAEMTILLKIPIEENNAEIVADPLPTVVADPTQMLELMQNLVSNAIKFHGPDRPKIAISASQGAGEWTFAVKDNGIGLNMQYADKIFQMFQRLHGRGEYPGTGIGLALCKRIVERHGGRIWVESEPGRGSVFYFTIPNAPRHGAKMVTTSGSSTTIGPCA